MQNQNTKYIGVVGSRILPLSHKEEIEKAVKYSLGKGYDIISGGAPGTDNFALETLLNLHQSQRGIIFSAWQYLAQFPATVKDQIRQFLKQGGRINWGAVPFNACYNAVRAGLLGRNIRLAKAASGIFAFLYGQSRGTSFTIRQAAERQIPVVAFLCGDNAKLPNLPAGNWRALQNRQWAGAFRIVY